MIRLQILLFLSVYNTRIGVNEEKIPANIKRKDLKTRSTRTLG